MAGWLDRICVRGVVATAVYCVERHIVDALIVGRMLECSLCWVVDLGDER